MALTNSLRNIIIDSITGKKNPSSSNTPNLGISQAWLGLSSTAPTADGGNVTEPSVSTGDGQPTGYGRTLIGKAGEPGTQKFPDAVNGQAINNQYIYFPEALASWGPTLTHFVIFDGSGSSARVVAYAKLMKDGKEEPINVTNANTVVLFRPNDLTIKYVDVLES